MQPYSLPSVPEATRGSSLLSSVLCSSRHPVFQITSSFLPKCWAPFNMPATQNAPGPLTLAHATSSGAVPVSGHPPGLCWSILDGLGSRGNKVLSSPSVSSEGNESHWPDLALMLLGEHAFFL